MKQVFETNDFKVALEAVKSYQLNGKITTAFERKGNTKAFSHLLHTRLQMR